MPVAEELGAAPFLVVPEQNSAERQIARFEEGAVCRRSTPSWSEGRSG